MPPLQYWVTGSSLYLAASFVFAAVVGIIGIKELVSHKVFYGLLGVALVLTLSAWRSAAKQEEDAAGLSVSLTRLRNDTKAMNDQLTSQTNQLGALASQNTALKAGIDKIANSAHVSNAGELDTLVSAIVAKLPATSVKAERIGVLSIGQTGGQVAQTIINQGKEPPGFRLLHDHPIETNPDGTYTFSSDIQITGEMPTNIQVVARGVGVTRLDVVPTDGGMMVSVFTGSVPNGFFQRFGNPWGKYTIRVTAISPSAKPEVQIAFNVG